MLQVDSDEETSVSMCPTCDYQLSERWHHDECLLQAAEGADRPSWCCWRIRERSVERSVSQRLALYWSFLLLGSTGHQLRAALDAWHVPAVVSAPGDLQWKFPSALIWDYIVVVYVRCWRFPFCCAPTFPLQLFFFCTALHKVWIFMGSIYINASYHHHLFVFYVGCSCGSTLAHQYFWFSAHLCVSFRTEISRSSTWSLRGLGSLLFDVLQGTLGSFCVFCDSWRCKLDAIHHAPSLNFKDSVRETWS